MQLWTLPEPKITAGHFPCISLRWPTKYQAGHRQRANRIHRDVTKWLTNSEPFFFTLHYLPLPASTSKGCSAQFFLQGRPILSKHRAGGKYVHVHVCVFDCVEILLVLNLRSSILTVALAQYTATHTKGGSKSTYTDCPTCSNFTLVLPTLH